MSRILRRLSSYRVTPLGWVFLVVIVAALALGFFGPHVCRVPGLAIGLIGLALVVAENAGVGRNRGLPTALREAPGDPSAARPTEPAAREADEEAWQRERDRREREGR
jgi:hypothetical protein